jgi:hypothetical protein
MGTSLIFVNAVVCGFLWPELAVAVGGMRVQQVMAIRISKASAARDLKALFMIPANFCVRASISNRPGVGIIGCFTF